MSLTAQSPSILAFGAHPDDLEFGCGGILAAETHAGRAVHGVVCSGGEAGSHGTPAERIPEAGQAAAFLGISLEFIEFDGDSLLEVRSSHSVRLAALIRRHRPAILLAPTLVQNQHPDHWRLGQLVRDAARLARYGGLEPLRDQPPHTIDHLLFYAVTPGAEPTDSPPVFIDISAPAILAMWTAAMEAHVSQLQTRDYVQLQLARARVHGLAAGLAHAQPLWPGDPLVFPGLSALPGSARHF